MDKAMAAALEADGEKLRQLTGQDHGPFPEPPLIGGFMFGSAPKAPSPFLPGTSIQFAIDSTSLGWFKECPRKYYYHMVEGWRSKHEAVALRFGILYHSALENYDKMRAGETPIDHEEALHKTVLWLMLNTWDEATGAWRNSFDLPPDDRTAIRCRENLVRTVVWYLDKFKDDPAKTKLLEDGRPMVELSCRFELDYGPQSGVAVAAGKLRPEAAYETSFQPYVLCAHLDRIVEFQGVSFVSDRKTTGSTPGSYYFDQYDPDNQMSFYSVMAQVVFKMPIKGVIIDAAQVAVGFSRFVRGFVYKTPDQIEEWMKELKWWLRSMEDCATSGYWPANDKSCHKFGGCAFRKICSKSPSVRQKFLETDFVRHPWNPLEVR